METAKEIHIDKVAEALRVLGLNINEINQVHIVGGMMTVTTLPKRDSGGNIVSHDGQPGYRTEPYAVVGTLTEEEEQLPLYIESSPVVMEEPKYQYTVYGGNGHRRLTSKASAGEADDYARDFQQKCAMQGLSVPPAIIKKERV